MENSTPTSLVARNVNGIPVLSVEAQHPIREPIPGISHADAFFATPLPQAVFLTT
ncbi:MAG: hypothetical protein JXL84_01540 [Deltaproteobacteria bacterium]|nr:hypothetical protein [Deltaproteobacteria bacterium]